MLKNLKAAGGTAYQDRLSVLDAAVIMTEQSGLYSEIGKAGGHAGEADPLAVAKRKVSEIRKAHPELTEAQALDEVLLTDDKLREELDQ